MAPLSRFLAATLALTGALAASQSNCPTTTPVTIQSSGDATSAFSSCAIFQGSVVISSVAAGVIDLGSLQAISGDLTMTDATNVTSLTGTFLKSIGGTFTVQDIVLLQTINFPALNTVGDLVFSGLPNLATLTMNLAEINNFNVQNTFLPSLPSINATTVNSINIANNKQLNQMAFSVSTVTTSIDVENNGPSVTVQFPNLLTAQNITFRGCSDIEIPALRNVSGSLGFYESPMTSISAPNFTATTNQGTLAINANPALNNVSFPALTTVAGGIQIQNNTVLKEVEFDQLQNIGGAIDFYGAFDSVVMGALKNCRGGFNIQSTSPKLDCSVFDKEHGTSSVIKGTYKCSGNVTNPGNIGTAGTSGGTKKSGAAGAMTPGGAVLVFAAGALAVAVSML